MASTTKVVASTTKVVASTTKVVALPEDVVGCVLQYLNLASLQAFSQAALQQGSAQKSTLLLVSRRTIMSWVARRRIPWAVAILEKGCEFSAGPCVVHDCDRQRLSLFDLTGPVNYAFVLTPYCGACAAKHRGPYSFAV